MLTGELRKEGEKEKEGKEETDWIGVRVSRIEQCSNLYIYVE